MEDVMRDLRLLQAVRDRRGRLSGTATHSNTSPSPRFGPPVARRQFMQTGLGALAASAVVGRQLLRPLAVQAAGTDPIPVSGSPLLAPFNVWAPIVVDSIDAEPATITNFNGTVGMAYVSGTVRRTNLTTGHVDTLPFSDADMRFMQGVYRGVDGKPRQGTFGFV
jgi:hypothetical protein